MEFHSTEKLVEITASGGKWREPKVLMLGEEVQIWKERIIRGFFSYVELRLTFYILVYTCVVIWCRL